MGVVYRALDLKLRRLVAIKMILDPAHAGAEGIQRLQVEASTAAKVQHPAIASVYEVGEHDGKPYIVMEYVEGVSFDAELATGSMDATSIATVLRDVALALEHAHRSGVVHRDVKPANILLDAEGKPHLLDFGLARESTSLERLTVAGSVLGTPAYMSPEQAAGDTAGQGPLTDVYGLGAVLYRALAGRPVFDAPTLNMTIHKILSDDAEPIRRHAPKVPRDLETIALRCLAKEPERRYASAQAVADELDRFLRGEPILARPVGALGRAGRWIGRNKALSGALAGVVAALLALGALGAWAVQSRLEDRQDLDRRNTDRLHAVDALSEAQSKNEAGDLDGALAGYTRAIELDPLNPVAFNGRAAIEAKKKDWKAEIADLTRVLALDPRDVTAWRLRGDAHRLEGDFKTARDDYSKALALTPASAPCRYFRGLSRSHLDDVDGALEDYAKAIELDPTYVAAYLGRADLLLLKKKDQAGAIAVLTDAIDHLPTTPDFWSRRGTVLVSQGKTSFGLDDLTHAINLKPDNPASWIARARGRDRAGDAAGAIADFQKYLALSPRATDAAAVHSRIVALKGRPARK
jgi:tetratricopeptide (TPR) repeat protein